MSKGISLLSILMKIKEFNIEFVMKYTSDIQLKNLSIWNLDRSNISMKCEIVYGDLTIEMSTLEKPGEWLSYLFHTKSGHEQYNAFMNQIMEQYKVDVKEQSLNEVFIPHDRYLLALVKDYLATGVYGKYEDRQFFEVVI